MISSLVAHSCVLLTAAEVDKDLLDRLKNINDTLTTQWNRLQNIKNTVEDTGNLADKARNRVRETEKLIERAREELDKAKDAISKVVSFILSVFVCVREGERDRVQWMCFSSHQDIKIPTTTGDPNNMTLLAEEARRLAEK